MIISTAYIPSISWIEALIGGATIEAHENYVKQSQRNHAMIMTAGGVEKLTVPVEHNSGAKIAIRDARVDYAMPWQRVHRRAVEAAYRSSAYWEHFAEQILPLFDLKHKYLLDMNHEITTRLLETLGIDMDIRYTENFGGAQAPVPVSAVEYYQVFADRHPFAADMSVVDAIFCEGKLPSAE